MLFGLCPSAHLSQRMFKLIRAMHLRPLVEAVARSAETRSSYEHWPVYFLYLAIGMDKL